MSLYSTTDSNIFKPTDSVFTNYQRLSKFNKFYLTKVNFPININKINIPSNKTSIIKNKNKKNICLFKKYITPIKMKQMKTQVNLRNSNNFLTTSHSFKNETNSLNISKKIKNKYNPDILNTQYISKPNKTMKKFKNQNIIKYNSFLNNKPKPKSILINTFDCKSGNDYRIINFGNYDKPKINKDFIDLQIKKKLNGKKYITMCHSMKILLEKANKSYKRASTFMTKNFEKKFNFDKRENLKEYNKYMNVLQTNLNLSKSKSKFKNIFYYE